MAEKETALEENIANELKTANAELGRRYNALKQDEDIKNNPLFAALNQAITDLDRQATAAERLLLSQREKIQGMEKEFHNNRKIFSTAVGLARLAPWKYNPATNLFEFDDEFYAIYATDVAREGRFMAPHVYAREFVHPDDAEVVASEIRKGVASGERICRQQIEHRIIRRDGTVRTIVVLGVIEKDETGKIIDYFGANQDITERVQATENIKQKNRLMNYLHETGLRLMQRLDVSEILKMVVAQLTEILETPDVFIFLEAAEEEGWFSLRVGKGRYADYIGVRLRGTEHALGEVCASGQTVVIDHYSQWEKRYPEAVFDSVDYFVEVPLKSGDKTLGVIGLTYSQPGRTLAEHELDLLQRFAVLASIAVDNARLHDSMQKELQQRKSMQEALAGSEEKFFKAFQRVADGVGIVRFSDARYIDVNEAFTRIFGYTRQEMIGRTSDEIGLWCDKSDYQKVRVLLQTVGSVYNLEADFRAKSGDTKTGLTSSSVISVGNEKFVVLTVHDITDLKKAEQALREANEDLERKVAFRTQELTAVNQELTAMNEELIRANEELFRLNVEVKQTQDSLVRSEKMTALARLVAGMAHEINTPVGICVTLASHLEKITNDFSGLYRENALRRGDLEEYMAECNEAAHMLLLNSERAASLVRNFKQVSADQASEIRRVFGVKSYIEEILIILTAKLKHSRHQINIRCDEAITLDGYPGAFAQILTNLILNSLTHAFDQGDHGLIEIAAELVQDQLVLTYSDNGKGIEPAVLEKIYDPFFTTRRSEGGSGLGLCIVYNLVTQLYAGKIECFSQPGQGVSFVITIPRMIKLDLESKPSPE